MTVKCALAAKHKNIFDLFVSAGIWGVIEHSGRAITERYATRSSQQACRSHIYFKSTIPPPPMSNTKKIFSSFKTNNCIRLGQWLEKSAGFCERVTICCIEREFFAWQVSDIISTLYGDDQRVSLFARSLESSLFVHRPLQLDTCKQLCSIDWQVPNIQYIYQNPI